MSNDKEPKFWVTVVKLFVGAVVLITLLGLGLYYTAKFNTYEAPTTSGTPDWGISKDSPIRNNR